MIRPISRFGVRHVCLALLGLMALTSCQKSAKKADPFSVSPAASGVSQAPEAPSLGASATPVAPSGPAIEIAVSDAATATIQAQPLTSVGENSEARFSADGTRIVFVSRERPSHKQAQVYEMHLGQMTEKRLTFHDGDNGKPFYLNDGRSFGYSSSTDAIKSESFAVQRLMKTYYPEGLEPRATNNAPAGVPFDLYIQTLDGRSIERLTRTTGFDGDVESKAKYIVFSSGQDPSSTRLLRYNLKTKQTNSITDGQVEDRGARLSPDGKSLTWSRRQNENSSEIMIATGNFRNPRNLTAMSSSAVHPTWHPSGEELIFASNLESKNFNLFSVDRTGSCVKRLTRVDFDQLHPSLSPDGKKILFSLIRNGKSQLFMMDYRPPQDCWQPKS